MLKQKLDLNENLQKYLFIRGFLISNKEIDNMDQFPFYGNWKKEKFGNFWFAGHKLTGMHIYEKNNKVFFILGHAYNPFTMQYEELELLKRLADMHGTNDYIACVNELTGIFVAGVADGDNIEFYVDASGMQSACYAKIDDSFYVSSHPQLIGDICGLQMDDFVKELVDYKWYGRVMGPYLPADLTPFKEVKRIVPSIMYNFNGEIYKQYEFSTIKNNYNQSSVIEAKINKNNNIDFSVDLNEIKNI